MPDSDLNPPKGIMEDFDENSSQVLGKVTFLNSAKSEYEITTVAKVSIWVTENRAAGLPAGWGNKRLSYRNSLLFSIHPTIDWCVVQLAKGKKETEAKALDSFKPEGSAKRYFLDLASGTRNKGRFTFSKQPVGRSYFGEDWKRIIYGSVLHTPCKKLVKLRVKVAIVDDEGLNENGNPQDDPINKQHWKTGDSHAKATKRVIEILNLAEKNPDPNVPIQFRAAIQNVAIFKGTVAWNSELDGNPYGIDIAIPLSSMKGRKYPLGCYDCDIYTGTVFEAELRTQARPGWMLWQWFTWETLEKDGIIKILEEKAAAMAKAVDDVAGLAKIMAVEPIPNEDNPSDTAEENPLDTEAQYENIPIKIIRADEKGILLRHPYIVRRVLERMQKMWIYLVTAAGVRFLSVMCQPDESLSATYVEVEPGVFRGKKTCCAPDLEFKRELPSAQDKPLQGTLIVFCNPMRHWGDIQLWDNIKRGIYQDAHGILAAPRNLLLNLGRDTDGDFIQVSPAKQFPAIAQQIKDFSSPPKVKKFPKVPLTGNIQQVAIRSMNDKTGIVASLLARARSHKLEHLPMLFPNEPEYQGMTILDFLSQQLQIAVDSIKSAYPNDDTGLDELRAYFDGYPDKEKNPTGPAYKAPWLADLKTQDVYRTRPCAVLPEAEDTVSRLVKLVNGYWEESKLRWDEAVPYSYLKSLFSKVPFVPTQLRKCDEILSEYRTRMAAALEKKAKTGDDSDVKEVSLYYRELAKVNYNNENAMAWAAAMWHACHQAKSGDGGLVFNMFSDQIIERLKIEGKKPPARNILIYGVQLNVWGSIPGHRWMGETVLVSFVEVPQKGKQAVGATMLFPEAKTAKGWHYLGNVGEYDISKVTIGESQQFRIWTSTPSIQHPLAWEAKTPSKSVRLFALDVPESEIIEALYPGVAEDKLPKQLPKKKK